MKITDVKVYQVWVGHRNQCLVKVETDEGIYGWGESGVSGRELAVAGAVKHYREFLIGRDPMRRGALWQEMYRSQYFEGGRILTGAISAIDIALYDIVGKALGVPVYELLGGKHRDYVPCFATTGASTYEQLLENVNLLLENDWNVIRIGLAKGPIYDLLEARPLFVDPASRMQLLDVGAFVSAALRLAGAGGTYNAVPARSTVLAEALVIVLCRPVARL